MHTRYGRGSKSEGPDNGPAGIPSVPPPHAHFGVRPLVERSLIAAPFLLLLFVAGVQVGIAHGRALAAREARSAFLDTSCAEAVASPWPVRLTVTATAYSSTPDQTQGDPFITATGNRVGLGTMAVSRDLEALLPMGTRVFVVDDRMHRRWERRIDLWFPDRGSALRFGRRELTLEVFP